jgi:hypothetical protein
VRCAAGEHSTRPLCQIGVGACVHGLGHRHAVRIPGMEATVGIEPTIRVLQTRALPLGYVAIVFGFDLSGAFSGL